MSNKINYSLAKWYFNEFPHCGCGNPEGILKFVIQVLEAIEDKNKNTRKLVSDNEIGETFLNILTKTELIEHGSIVWASWLTDKGKSILKQLQEFDFSNRNWMLDLGVEAYGP